MNKIEIAELAKTRLSLMWSSRNHIDRAIKPLVDYLNNLGFITVASCSSHLLNEYGEKIDDYSAYVAFYYADEDIIKVEKFINNGFPKLSNYEITFKQPRLLDIDENFMCVYIDFSTKRGRAKTLTAIYQKLGIKLDKKLALSRKIS